MADTLPLPPVLRPLPGLIVGFAPRPQCIELPVVYHYQVIGAVFCY